MLTQEEKKQFSEILEHSGKHWTSQKPNITPQLVVMVQ